MNLNLDPAQLSLEQLLELVRQLIAENARLRAEIEELKRKNARSAAPFSKNTRRKNPKPPGRKAGQGVFRNRPAPPPESYTSPLEDVPVREDACPDCGGELADAGTEVVTNTELPPAPKPEVKAYCVHIRSCRRCKRKVRGRHPEVASDQFGATAHRLGPRAQAAAAILHYEDGIPQCKAPRVLESLTGLQVTKSALIQSAIRLGTGQGVVARQNRQLREQAKEQPVIHTDDTGWRVNGKPAQMMVFESPAQVVYQIRPRHRNEEVREVIGDNYQGTLCTDRGKSYDAKELQNVEQQKCLAHIQRSIDKVLESKQGSARRFGTGLKALLKEAGGLYHEFHKAEGKLSNYPERARELDLRITDYLRPRVLSDADNHRLLNEIGRHHDRGNLLRFLHSPQTIEPTNNAAERALRPAVIARKVSHCSKNERGAAAYTAFKSVIGTLKKSGGKTLEKLKELITSGEPEPAILANTS